MFLSLFGGGRRASADGDRSPFGSFWFEPLGARSTSGMRVTGTSAMRLSAVYACVRVLSESFAVLPFRLFKKRSDGGRDEVLDHWLVKLMNRPNQFQTGFEWREMMQGHLCLRGNAFNEMVFGAGGSVTALLPLHPDRVKVEYLVSGSYRYVVTRMDGKAETLPREAIWHIRGLSSDGIVGLNPMEMAAEVVGMGLAAQSFGARFFANDASIGGWIEFDGKFANTEAKKTFRESWQQTHGGSNRGKTAVLEKGFKYHQLAVNNSDNQFLELTQKTDNQIAGIFRVPPHKIGILDRATFSNIEQQTADFIVDGMLPWTQRWEASIKAFLLLEEDQDLVVDFDFSILDRGDRAARSKYYTDNIGNGSLTRNEARIMEGRNPLPGLDEPLQPLNMAVPGEEPDPDAPQDSGAPQKKPPPAAPAKKKKAESEADRVLAAAERMGAIATAAAARLARKETAVLLPMVTALPLPVDQIDAFYGKHVDFVAETLGICRGAADDYVKARRRDEINKGSEEQDIYRAALAKLETLALKGTL